VTGGASPVARNFIAVTLQTGHVEGYASGKNISYTVWKVTYLKARTLRSESGNGGVADGVKEPAKTPAAQPQTFSQSDSRRGFPILEGESYLRVVATVTVI
jgi:hypothetical protein